MSYYFRHWITAMFLVRNGARILAYLSTIRIDRTMHVPSGHARPLVLLSREADTEPRRGITHGGPREYVPKLTAP
jgi:hypothetical protein